ncbi:MAG: CDP-alcohol phosphatidyltransferase family protein [Candidatus Brocadiia bacterium]
MPESNRTHLLINLLTGSRLGLALAVAVLTPWSADQRAWAVIAATMLVLLIEGSDLADGYLARRHDVVSHFGKLFDPYTDSLSRLTVYWSLAVAGRCLVFVPLIMAARDISVSYIRILLTRQGRDVSARWWGKLKAIIQGVSALVLISGPLWWGEGGAAIVWTLSFLVVLVTLGSAAAYARLALTPPSPDETAPDA